MTDNPPLNIPVIDAALDPAPHNPPAGDWTDDDGAAIDSYLEAANQGPLLYAVVEAVKQQLGGPKASRLIRRRYLFTSATNDQSVQALPADPNRTMLALSVSPVGANAGIYMSDTPFNVTDNADNPGSNTPAFKVEKSSSPFIIPNYTGPLYVCGATLDGVTVSRVDILAVTF